MAKSKYLPKDEFSFVFFGERKINQPNNCFMAGLHGCKSIIGNHLGYDGGGIEICNYTVNFDDGSHIEINDPIYATNTVVL